VKCPRCQHENREGRRFCSECGASLALPCPACHFANDPGEKFCGGCGALLRTATGATTGSRFSSPESYTPRHLADKILTSKAALEGERKQVTVLFADLKGSMELLADRDPEEARKLLDPVLERMIEAVHHYDLACPSCGAAVPPGRKFCGTCGKALTVQAESAPRFASPAAYTPKHLAEKILTSPAALEGNGAGSRAWPCGSATLPSCSRCWA